jgi:hypothetical protein
VATASNTLKKRITTHGALMMTAFVGLMPLAILAARYKWVGAVV